MTGLRPLSLRDREGPNLNGALPGYRPDDLNAPRGASDLQEDPKSDRAGGLTQKNADSNGVIGPGEKEI